MPVDAQTDVQTAEKLRAQDIRDATVTSMNFEGPYSVLIEFSNGVVTRLHPADDHWMSFVGEKVEELSHSDLGKFSFLRIRFQSGKVGLFRT